MSHLTSLLLGRLSAGDLDGAAREQAEAHVGACSSCAAALAELHEARRSFLAERPPEAFMLKLAARRARRRRSVWMGGGTAALLAAAMLIFFLRPAGDLRMKGRGLTVYRKRGDVATRLGDGDTIRAGDALEVSMPRLRESHLWIWAVDSDGRVDALGDSVVPAGDAPLPSSAMVVEAPCRDLSLVVGERAASEAELKALAEPGGQGFVVRRLRCE